jgi:putative endonuclease
VRSDAAAKELGRRGEDHAAEHFSRLGYRVLARNARTRRGELDLVLATEDGRTIVFAEVKTRRLGTGDPWDKLDAAKCRQVRRMAIEWLMGTDDRPWWADMRFDAIGITLTATGDLVRLDHLEAAF